MLGPHFETIAREFIFKFASERTVGGRLSTVGPAVINDASERAQHELDVVAIESEADGSQRVLAIGEAKHTRAKRTPADLTRLEHIRDLIAIKQPSAQSARLLLFSANGFDRNLSNQSASRDDVELIDLERIYTGD